MQEREHLHKVRLEELRRDIQKGIESGSATPLNLEEIKARGHRRLAALNPHGKLLYRPGKQQIDEKDTTMTHTVEQIISSMRERIDAVDQDLMMDVVGVAQALDELRKALDEVNGCLDRRDFDKAADLGYSSVSSGFIFLQRTLGALKGQNDQKSIVVSEVAAQLGCAYEEALPHVDAAMESAHPRSAD